MTNLLPGWKACLKDLGLAIRIMPQDVSTWWNSTYDMLCFAIEYQKAIENMTSECKNDLWQFELIEDKWVVATQLNDMLEVHDSFGDCDAM